MGWYYLPVVLLSSTLALGVALVLNNIQRRYPVFWWEPAVPATLALPLPENDSRDGEEKKVASSNVTQV